MRKIAAAVIAALIALGTLVLLPSAAFADSDPTGPAITRDAVPPCYDAGLLISVEPQPCLDVVTCDRGDVTCNWLCDPDSFLDVSITCSYEDYPLGIRNWMDVLYYAIGHYRSQLADALAVVSHHEKMIDDLRRTVVRKNDRIIRLHNRVHRLRHRLTAAH